MVKRKLLRGGAFDRIDHGNRQMLVQWYSARTGMARLWLGPVLDNYFIPSSDEIAQNLEDLKPGREWVNRIVKVLNHPQPNLIERSKEIRDMVDIYSYDYSSLGAGYPCECGYGYVRKYKRTVRRTK